MLKLEGKKSDGVFYGRRVLLVNFFKADTLRAWRAINGCMGIERKGI
jgi:hypothetical protein